MKNEFSTPGLTGNQLKLIALAAMTLDHIGVLLLPGIPLLRILGRIAFPIFAWMIAEGCQHTHHRKKYLLSMWGLAATCQAVYFLSAGSLYMSVLVSFSLAIGLIYALDYGKTGGIRLLAPVTALCAVIFLALDMPQLLSGTDYALDYGLWGVLLPVLVYLAPDKPRKLLAAALALSLIALESAPFQWYSLAALPLLALYSGRRGKHRMKYLFYIYYPLHLVILQGIALL